MSHEIDQKIQEVYKRIQTERKYLQGYEGLRRATNNVDVQRQTDAQIKEAQRSLSYFEDTLRELQARKLQLQQPQTSPASPSPPSGPPGHRPQASIDASRPGLPSNPRNRTERALPAPPPQSFPSNDGSPYAIGVSTKPKNYTNLDLIKADTPYSTAKINRRLQQLKFKQQVELQYRKAIDQMIRLYQADGDKKSRQDAESKRIESERKIQLFKVAVKRYDNLHVLDDVTDDDAAQDPADGERKDNLRKPLSGKLQVTIREARDLNHAPVLKRSSKAYNETTVALKVEEAARATSHPSRTDRWNESLEITVDKANEVEIVIYDKQGADHAFPIGLLWIRISDIVEALRKQRVGNEQEQAGWVSAGKMGGQSGSAGPSDTFDLGNNLRSSETSHSAFDASGPSGAQEGISAWFTVEPVGAIALNINFVKENVRKRPLDAGGLGRQGAVRMRKGEVHEMNGHKFIQRQFYQIMLCAFCNEFLRKGSGYQCEDCRYTCHKECYPKVVTKCISKSNAETEADEDKINHRIPHRFETITNMSANWCCHCGYVLPLGRKNAKKCTECDITCHASCTHLVPDFCGMSMETANTLIRQIQDIKSHQKQTKTHSMTKPPSSPYAATQPGKPPMETITSGMGSMNMGNNNLPPGASPPYAVGTPTTSIDSRRQSTGGVPGYPAAYPYNQSAPPVTKPSLPPTGAPGYGYDQPPVTSPPGKYGPPGPGQMYEQPAATYDRPPPGPPYSRPPPPTPPTAASNVLATPTNPPIQYASPTSPSAHAVGMRPPPEQQAQSQAVAQNTKRKVGLDDFNFLAVLGKGNFGKVMLAEEKKTNGLYAIKVLKKEFIIDNDEVESTRSEKRVFLAAARERHPFLLGLHSCFQTETRIYFVMEYVSGGDLMLHIQRKQFSPRQARFYAAEVLLALEYFHANGIVYRDLKLDNILLTLDGHVKVADYGLCKEEMWFGQTTSTFCGTPEFMAPEILLEQRYGRAVDWWAFGVLTYEMLLGQSPFRGDDEDEIFDAILEDEPLYPITMPRDAVSILQKLLTRDPTRRLGSGKTDATEIKAHPFFKDTNWDDVVNKRIPPPYYPTISNPSDVSNFDQEFTREQPTLTPVHGQLSAQDQSEFQGFSWVATWADI